MVPIYPVQDPTSEGMVVLEPHIEPNSVGATQRQHASYTDAACCKAIGASCKKCWTTQGAAGSACGKGLHLPTHSGGSSSAGWLCLLADKVQQWEKQDGWQEGWMG